MVIVAPGIIPPVGSVTVPDSELNACPKRTGTRHTVANTTTYIFLIKKPPGDISDWNPAALR
jgi:hypothetical protein